MLLRERRRWLMPALLFFVSTISYLDRQTLSVLAGTLRLELGLTPSQYGTVVTSFLVAYGLGFCFSGRLIDRFGVKPTFAWALALWSSAAMLHSLASGERSLIFFRFLLGLGESFATPTAAKVLAAWIPRRERGMCTAVFSTGNFVGAMVAPPLVAWLTLSTRWQFSFLVTGGLGFVLLAVWLVFYREPERHPLLTENERRHILAEFPGPVWSGVDLAPAPASHVVRVFLHPLFHGRFLLFFCLLDSRLFPGLARLQSRHDRSLYVDPLLGR